MSEMSTSRMATSLATGSMSRPGRNHWLSCGSARMQEDGAGRLDLAFEDAGEQQLKNIARPVHVYRVRPGAQCRCADLPSIGIARQAVDRGTAARQYERRSGA